MPVTANRQVNISSGITTWGTTGTVVRKLHGITQQSGQVVDKNQVVKALGWLGPSPISAQVSQTAEVSFEGVCVYEDLPTILNGFFTGITASTSAAAPYLYPYTAPVSSTQVFYHFTMEFGTSGAVYRSNGTVFNDLTIKGEAGDLWNYTVGAVAKQIINGTTGVSTSVADRPVNVVRMADTTLYVDAFTATGATTAVSATLINFELDYKTGRHVKTFAGSVFPGDFGESNHEPTLKLTAEFNASAKAYVDELLGSTGAAVKRAIKIRSSASSSTITAAIHFAGQLVDGVKLFDDRYGNMTVGLNFSGVYSTAMANSLLISIENGSSSVTT
ncbi:MAG: hypothetical protein Q7O66_22140 [Dehalococcoidia bacterium]|nr:hypothetical protein [Dehalococcoidia bacterium]